MSWEKVKLGELYNVHNGLSKGKQFFGSGYPFLSFSTVFNNWFLPKTLSDLVQSSDKERESYSILRGDIFITRTSETMDELGMSSVALRDYPNATYNGFTKRLRPIDSQRILPEFIGYYLRCSEFRNQFVAFSTMTTRASLRNEDLLSIEVPVPTMPTQRRIADVLSAYDDLIENNRKQIKLLEEAAQRLYQEWFVDLRFPGHEHTKIVDGVPEGWEKRLLGDVVEVKYGKDHKSIPDGLIPVYGSGGFMRKCNQVIYDGESVLIPRKGSLNNIIYVDEAFWTVDTMFYTKMKLPDIGIFVYFFVKSFDMYSMNIGAAVPSMTTNILNALDIIIPNNDVLGQFQSVSKNFFNKIALLHKQIETATQARDRLLPKLKNGEVEV
mgnify:CR=1 FL=1